MRCSKCKKHGPYHSFATFRSRDGEVRRRGICKDPLTDSGTKKSAKGLLCVREGKLMDQQCHIDVESDLKPVFRDGKLLTEVTLRHMRSLT